MSKREAFARSKEMFAAISAAMFAGKNMPLFFATLDEYKSRGHGGKYRPKSAKQQRIPNSGRYVPHQGKQEMERRAARKEHLSI